MKLASIDIGTNTIRLLIGEVGGDGRVRDALLKREITRLGGGFDGEKLHSEAKQRTLTALKSFAAILAEAGVKNVRAAATSIVREARDGLTFLEEVKVQTGIAVEVIDGETEATLTLKGVLSALEKGGNRTLVFDIGGGSTEYILSGTGGIVAVSSLNMGVVSLAEARLHSDPPSKNEVQSITEEIDRFLLSLEKKMPPLNQLKDSDTRLVGTAGTITTLAALDQDLEVYDSRKINNYLLTKAAVESLFQRLTSMRHAERAALRALEEGRADLIIPGTLIVLETMTRFGFDEMVVSDYGLLEGLLLDLAEREGNI